MRVLLHTNILISREDPDLPPEGLTDLLGLLSRNKVTQLIHPASIGELEHDRNAERRNVILAKARAYPRLEQTRDPPESFMVAAKGTKRSNDFVDAVILYSVKSDAVSFLITEDRELLHRASRVGVQDRTLTIRGGLEYFSALFARALPSAPMTLTRSAVHALDLTDSFFDSIKRDYPGFED